MDKIFKIAVPELGQKEEPGSGHNPNILNYAHEAGFPEVIDDETPWCSIFINWVAMKANLNQSKQLSARSWLLVGQNVDSTPAPGDIVIFWRNKPESWEGHVAIFFGFSADGTRVFCLGGNQGNQVSISAYPRDTVLGFRRLSSTGMVTVPNKVLKLGSTGSEVKELQEALKTLGFDCGTTDGDFGPKTEKAVKQLQSMKIGLKVDGVYNKETRDVLVELLNG